jgi:hypothetical protein
MKSMVGKLRLLTQTYLSLSDANICMITRYIDDIFFTSNESLEKINEMLNKANNFHPNIKLVRQIGTTVSFLDVFIENKNGTFATSVYRKDSTEPYIVPFRSDHPRHIFDNIIDGALMRALSYSSTLPNFNQERRLIKLMLLYNGLVFHDFLCLFYCCVTFSLPAIHQDTSTLDSRNFLSTNYHPHRSYLILQLITIFYSYARIY